MKIFVDTAQINEIQETNSWGILDGVTTNPSLIKKAVESRENVDIKDYIGQICETVDGPISLEVIGLTAEKMVDQAERLYDTFNHINNNVVIKIPVNTTHPDSPGDDYEGLKAIRSLATKGIPTNTTLVMKPEQALLAAKAGTQYVSPFAGRIDDFIRAKVGLTRGEDYPKSAYHDSDWLKHSSYLNLKSCYRDLEDENLKRIYTDEEVNENRAKITDEGVSSGSAAV